MTNQVKPFEAKTKKKTNKRKTKKRHQPKTNITQINAFLSFFLVGAVV